MSMIHSVSVFCGSNSGRGNVYSQGAAALGETLAQRGLTAIYGGTCKGLMSIFADAALAVGGQVHGVITERLHGLGHTHPMLSTLEVVSSMRERKARMAALGDAYIALPGGVGTLEEFFEVWVMAQLEGIAKPLGLLNINGYFNPLTTMIDHMIAEQFLPASQRAMIVIEEDPAVLLDAFTNYVPVTTAKWL
jgi:uncharacterized protein (TIGR00730 family)